MNNFMNAYDFYDLCDSYCPDERSELMQEMFMTVCGETWARLLIGREVKSPTMDRISLRRGEVHMAMMRTMQDFDILHYVGQGRADAHDVQACVRSFITLMWQLSILIEQDIFTSGGWIHDM